MKKKKDVKKKNLKRGFTLAETMLSMLILLLATSVAASGIPTAKRACDKVILAANSEILLSTAITTLRGELGMAQKAVIRDRSGQAVSVAGERITFLNPGTGAMSELYINDSTKEVMFRRYAKVDGMGENSAPVPLVSKEASTKDLFLSCDSFSKNGDIVCINGLCVEQESTRAQLAKRDTLSIRVTSD